MQIDAAPASVTQILEDIAPPCQRPWYVRPVQIKVRSASESRVVPAVRRARMMDQPVTPSIARTLAIWLTDAAGEGSLLRELACGKRVDDVIGLIRELNSLEREWHYGWPKDRPLPRWRVFLELGVYITKNGLPYRRPERVSEN